MALQMPAFISGLLPNGMTPTQQVNNPNPSGVFDPQTGNVLPPQLLGGRLNAANEMLREGSSGAPVGSWTQGMNRVLQGLVGGYEEKKYADQYMQGMQQGAQAGGNFLSSLMGGGAGSTPTAAPAPGSTSGAPSSPSASLAQYGPLFSATEQKYNLPSGFLMQTAQIENGGNVNTKDSPTGAKGPFQFTSGTAKAYGLTDPYDINASTDAAARLAADNAKYLSAALGRAPTAGELYLAHQQGAQGAAQLLTHPDTPATDVADPHNLAVNGYKPGQTAGQFASMFTGRFGNTGAAPPPNAQAATSLQPPGIPGVAVDTSQQQAGTPATPPGPVQVASLDPSAGVAQAAQQANIPLPPVDPRTAGATPGQQAVLSAASPTPAALPGGPAAPPLTPGGQSVVAALPAAGGAPSAAPPLSQGGQQVAQAALPPLPQQQGISPELLHQYTQIMQNPYVSDGTKAMVNQAIMSRISPHGVDNVDAGDKIIQVDKLTGQPLRTIPKANFQKITMPDGSEHIVNMSDPQQAASVNGMNNGGTGAAQTNQLGYSINSSGGVNMFPGQKLDTDQQSYNAFAAQNMQKGVPASQLQPFQDFQLNLHRAGGAQVNMNQQTDWDKLKDKAVFDHINPYIEQGRDAAQRLRLLNYLDGVITQYGDKISTGPGADAVMKIKESLVNAGLADPNAAGPTEILQHVGTMLAQQQAKALTSRPTQFDFGTMLRNDPNASMSLAGSHALINLGIQDANRDMELGRSAYGWLSKNGPTSDPTTFDSVVQDYDKQHVPVLPNFGTPTSPGAPSAPAPNQQRQGQTQGKTPVKLPITGDMNADWDSLMAIPEGDQYIGPNNQIYTKMNNSQYKKPGSK